jgi:GTP-binding protein
MNFIDEASLELRAGSGGSGASSFRREKYIPFGGPDGGDGGRGGSIFFRATKNINTLIDFQNKKILVAKNGSKGAGKNKTGQDANNLILEVPIGTIVFDSTTNKKILDCCKEEDYLIAKGGKGGLGNARFKTSTNQAPRKFTNGSDGEIRNIKLELRSLADVGLVGFPNAGKSTFLNKVSAAKPKIGNYPFTTLRPNLGTIKGSNSSYVIADIPGLIEGASDGAGLGIKFLKHITRTGLLLYFIDLAPDAQNSAKNQVILLKKELSKYKEDLIEKESWIVCNKSDLFNKEDLQKISDELDSLDNHFKKKIYFISAFTGSGTINLINDLEKSLFS